MSRHLSAFALICLCFVTGVRADERILSFDSEVTVHPDGKLSVRETIRMRAEGRQIRRGIFRDFPTIYPRQGGGQVVVGFAFRSATRDGQPETWRVEAHQNGQRMYLGSASTMLPHGEHTYELRYDTDRQMGYFAEHDELYWNATGNGWVFPIDKATAKIILPAAIPIDQVRITGYTGRFDAANQSLRASTESGRPEFETLVPLGPNEGLTVVATWPKGFIMPGVEAEQPLAAGAQTSPGYDSSRDAGHSARLGWAPLEHIAGKKFSGTHAPLGLAIVGLALLIAFYLWIWNRVGRDPPGKVIIPEYEPPPGFSPAGMRYLHEWGYDNQCFAAAVLNLAVKGHLRLEEESGLLGFGRTYTLHKLQPSESQAKELSADERELVKEIFRRSDKLELKQENHARVLSALSTHERLLDASYAKGFFSRNAGWHFLGVLLTIVISALVVMLPGATDTWPDYFFAEPGGWVAIATMFLMWVTIFVFAKLLKAPSVKGRADMDRIEGFKMYLEVAEGEALRKVDRPPPPLTPQLFEAYLPMALALGVEQRWAERFAAACVLTNPNAGYSPLWYAGNSFNMRNIGAFSSQMGSSLTSAISSSSMAPGTKSGGGGGGRSGGGGGGGGGGGW
jgi:uncharacterized membrane protein YgcG